MEPYVPSSAYNYGPRSILAPWSPRQRAPHPPLFNSFPTHHGCKGWLSVGTSVAGRPSFWLRVLPQRRTLASTRSGPEFQPSPRELDTGTFSRDNASTPTPPLPLSSQALSQGVVTHFKDCQSVSLGGDAWPSVGGPLVGHWGQQTLGLTAASPPQCNLHHHHRFPPHPLSPLFDTLPRFHRLASSL